MNRTQLIVRIIERLYDKSDHADLKQILEEELPDFSRIDEERMMKLYEETYTKDWDCSTVKLMMEKYNSTLPPALVPLPKEMPKDLTRFAMGHDVDEVWDKIISEYGTPANNLQPLPKEIELSDILWQEMNKNHKPSDIVYEKLAKFLVKTYGTPSPKPSLPTVEELAKEIESHGTKIFSFSVESIAKNLHDKYALPTREWWQDCEKFMYKGRAYKKYSHEVFPDGRTVLHSQLAGHNLIYCTPYIPPTADDIIAKHNLSEEEVKILREGKCT